MSAQKAAHTGRNSRQRHTVVAGRILRYVRRTTARARAVPRAVSGVIKFALQEIRYPETALIRSVKEGYGMCSIVGTCLTDADIHAKDLVVFKETAQAKHGDFVLIKLNGRTLVKQIRYGARGVELHWTNPTPGVMILDPKQHEWEILGVVCQVIRQIEPMMKILGYR